MEECGFAGNSDLYGLGIRLGIYLQWITSQIAVYFRLDGSSDLSDAYITFSTALMIATLVLTFSDEKSYPVEVVIILYMFFGGLYSVRSYQSRRKREVNPGLWRLVLFLASFYPMTIYASWFWITGRSGNRFNHNSCGTVVFLTTKVDAKDFHKASIFFAVLSVMFAAEMPFVLVLVWRESILRYTRKIWSRIRGEAVESAEDLPLDSPVEVYKTVINRDRRDALRRILRHRESIPPAEAASAHLDHIDLGCIVIKVGFRDEGYYIFLSPPLNDIKDFGKKFDELAAEAQEYLGDDDSIGTPSEAASIRGRLRVSWWRLRWTLDAVLHGRKSVGAQQYKLDPSLALLSTIQGLSPYYSIIAIELTIRWNHITDVYTIKSTGQLIPFVIGVAGVFKVWYDIRLKYVEMRKEKDDRLIEDTWREYNRAQNVITAVNNQHDNRET